MSEEMNKTVSSEEGAEVEVKEVVEEVEEVVEEVVVEEKAVEEVVEEVTEKATEEAVEKAVEKAEIAEEKAVAAEGKMTFKRVLNAIRGVLEDEDIDDVDTGIEADAEKALETSPDAKAKKGKLSLRGRFKWFFGNRLINRLIIFLIAVAMLAMTFVPFVTYQVQGADNTVYTVEYSGVDTVQISLFSFLVGGSAGTPDTAGYEQALNQITDPEAKVALIRQMMLASAVYSQKGFQLSTLIAAALFAVYALFCTIFVFMAAVNLITEFFTGKKTRHRVKRCASDTLLCFLVCLLPLLCFAMLQACEICTGVGVLSFLNPVGGAHLSKTAIWTLVLAGIAGVLACGSHSLGMLRVDKHYFDRRRIKHVLAFVLIAVIMVATLLPCLQVQMIDIQSGKEMVLDVNLWEIREMTTKEWILYRSGTTRVDQVYVSALGAMPELPENAGEIFFNTMLIPSNAGAITYLMYSVIEIVTLLTLAFAGVWLFAILRRGFFGKKRRFMINLFRILTLICVCANFVLVLLIKSFLDMNLQGNLLYIMRFSVGKGMLVMFLCALLGVVLRMREKRPIRYADEEYDNADVSYAPYVLDDKKARKHKKHKEDKEEKRERKEAEKEEKKEKKAQAKQENKSNKDNNAEEVTETEGTETVETADNEIHAPSGLSSVAKAFMIVGTVVSSLTGFLIPLAWCLPMTISYSKKVKKGRPIGTGFKVCSLIFVNTIAGILMLCDKNK